MTFVTFTWSLIAAVAMTMAFVCAFMWLGDRRDLAKLMFCATAIATAVATPFELGMMQAATTSEFGEQLRWCHLPIFFILIGQMLFVRYYVGTGRQWLLWTIIPIRAFVLVANFLVQPNFNFREISSLRHIEFLGARISVVGDATPRNWQWLSILTIVLLIIFVVDATVQAWRKGGSELRRRALIVSLAIIVPMMGNLVLNQLVAFGVLHLPLCGTLWFLGTLAAIAFELGREFIMNSRARLQLAELRRQWAQVERVNSLGQLAAALAHELIQPLTATATNLETASTHLLGANPELGELRAIMDDLHKDNHRAVAIIDRMRTFIKGGTMMQSFRMDEVADNVFSIIRQDAISRRVDLQCCLPTGLPMVTGDRVHISQVMLNLITNGMDAVQAQPASARQVVLEARTDEHATLEVAVRDSGPGIPEGRFEEIFSPFFTTKTRGMGVGLTLSRMIVEAHGGRLWAENDPTCGAIFRFTLPHEPESTVSRQSA